LSAYDIAGWAEFLAVAAGVAATLTGLIFVAMSINLARILEFPGLPEFAAETIVQLFGAMIISLVALVPGQSSLAVGVELAVAGAILWILQTRLQLRSLKRLRARKDNDQRRPVISIVLASATRCGAIRSCWNNASTGHPRRPLLARAGGDFFR